MSRVADFDRDTAGMQNLFDRVCDLHDHFFSYAVIGDVSETADLYKLYDMVITQRAVLSAMICSAHAIGTHGSAFVDRRPDQSGGQIRQNRTVTAGEVSRIDAVSPMPDPELEESEKEKLHTCDIYFPGDPEIHAEQTACQEKL